MLKSDACIHTFLSLYIRVDLGQFGNVGTFEHAIILIVRSRQVRIFIKIIKTSNIFRLKYPNYDVNKNKIEMEIWFLFLFYFYLFTSPDRPVRSELFYRLRYRGPQEDLSGGIYLFTFHKFSALLLLVNGEGLAVCCLKRVGPSVPCLSVIAAEKRRIPLDSCLPCSCVVIGSGKVCCVTARMFGHGCVEDRTLEIEF